MSRLWRWGVPHMALVASVLCAKKRHSPVGARKISVSKVTSVTLDPVASARTRQRDAGLDGGLPTAARAGARGAFSHRSPGSTLALGRA
jgi:hypothetical protein